MLSRGNLAGGRRALRSAFGAHRYLISHRGAWVCPPCFSGVAAPLMGLMSTRRQMCPSKALPGIHRLVLAFSPALRVVVPQQVRPAISSQDSLALNELSLALNFVHCMTRVSLAARQRHPAEILLALGNRNISLRRRASRATWSHNPSESSRSRDGQQSSRGG